MERTQRAHQVRAGQFIKLDNGRAVQVTSTSRASVNAHEIRLCFGQRASVVRDVNDFVTVVS